MELSIREMFLTQNEWSRPMRKLRSVKGLVIHWVANPETSAEANRNFFENRKYGKTDYGSAQYIVGQKGEIILCMPETEVAYAVGSPTYTKEALTRIFSDPVNDSPSNYTISIECCHIDWEGRMTKETYDSTLELAVDILYRHNLTESDLWLHQEVVGWKDCHRWFVRNPDEWKKFKELVGVRLRYMKLKEEIKMTISKYFTDIPENLEWAVESADRLYEKKIVKGDGQGHLNPTANITRAEAVVLIDRAVEYILSQINK